MTTVPHPCAFPACAHDAVTPTGMCALHTKVRVHASYVNDKHSEGGHG